jgi:ssDNA-binding replication factor A large subunit
MADDNSENIHLSIGAIKSLEEQKVSTGAKKSLDVDYIFQIERATKNSAAVYNCTLLDNDSKYGGFLLQYEQKDGIPGIGDIIHVSKILIAVLPSRDSHIYYCKNVKLLRRAMALQVDPNKLSNISKKKSLENHKNSVYKAQNEKEKNNNNSGAFDDSGCNLISSLTTFTNNAHLYLKCKVKNPLKNFVAKSTKKDCILQSFIFSDTKGDEIQATCFGKTAENLSKYIQEGAIYEIRKPNIQLADRAFNPTKCDYRLLFNESTQITPAPDNGKFGGVKFSIIPIEEILDLPIGKLIDIFGFILEDKGYQEFSSKNDKIIKHQKIVLGDDTFYKIEVTLWDPIGNNENNFSLGDLIALKNCRIREFNGKKILSTTESSELRTTLDPENDKKLRTFFNDHQNINEFKDIQGESVFTGNKSPADLVFIKDIQNTYDIEMENKDRPTFELYGTVTKLNHSDRNYYIGCSKCSRKMETEVCTFCSGTEKKTILTFSVNIRDASSFFWVDLFGDVAEKFLGIKGEEYENILKNGTTVEENEELININEKIEYHTFSFVGKVRENIFNETKRYRFSVFRFSERTPTQIKSLAKMLSTILK